MNMTMKEYILSRRACREWYHHYRYSIFYHIIIHRGRWWDRICFLTNSERIEWSYRNAATQIRHTFPRSVPKQQLDDETVRVPLCTADETREGRTRWGIFELVGGWRWDVTCSSEQKIPIRTSTRNPHVNHDPWSMIPWTNLIYR